MDMGLSGSAKADPWPKRVWSSISQSKVAEVVGFRDFRLLWLGAFVSFTGSWVSNIARGYYVFRLTGDESKLGLVNFAWSLPVCLLGLFAGSVTDMFDKRRLLVIAQLMLGSTAIFLAVAIYLGFVTYWMILVMALINGLVSTIEMPTRQSIVSQVVPRALLPSAIPINAMTFNVARVLGPAIGAVALATMGVASCFLFDGLSYLAIVWSVMAIKANLQAVKREPQPLLDLITEGARYTWRDRRLRALFLLENITAIFGLGFIPLLPAFVQDVMHQGWRWIGGHQVDLLKQGIGYAYTAMGVGSLLGLLLATRLAEYRDKGAMIKVSMLTMGVGLPILSVCSTGWLAYPMLAIVGAAMIIQLNTTNALFQMLSPEKLRGRVLAMHIWAVNGLAPFGVLLFGWIAKYTRIDRHIILGDQRILLPIGGVALVLVISGILVMLGAIAALFSRRGLSNLHVVVE